MQKKILNKIIFAVIFCTSFACSQAPKDPFVLSHIPHIQVLEKQDHGFCSSLKIGFDNSDDYKSGLYWRCRLSLTKYRLYTDNSTAENERHNLEISDLITKISLKLADTPEAILTRENKKMDERQHQRCLAMGFTIATEDQAKIEDYFVCRKTLIEEQQLVPPFGNTDYLEYPNRSYNIGFAIDQRADKDLKSYFAAKDSYPTCVKFNLNNVNFKNCTAAQDKMRQCFGKIEKQKFKKEYDEKIVCQQQSYIKFPNELLKVDDAAQAEIDRMNTNSDYYNKYSLASLGLDSSEFASQVEPADPKEKEKLAKEKKAENAKKINSKAGLYTKYELTKLRQKYIFLCQKEADGRIAKYVDELNKNCSEMEKFEIVGEE